MRAKLAVTLTIWLLKGSLLSNEQRQLLTGNLLQKLGALPLHARITLDETGTVIVDGKRLNFDRAKKLQDSSQAVLRNYARGFVRSTLRSMAIHIGVHDNTSPDQGLFAKAVLWVMQEEDKLFELLALHGSTDNQ